MTWEHSETIEIAASPAEVYAAVSQLERMGDWSPENQGGAWIKGDGSTVGDQFDGKNVVGQMSWNAVAEVVQCDPNESFCFTVGGLEEPVAEWGYHLKPTETGTEVTETWKMTRLPDFLAEGTEEQLQGRINMISSGMATTLANLKAALES